jgi:hypothetical protein
MSDIEGSHESLQYSASWAVRPRSRSGLVRHDV